MNAIPELKPCPFCGGEAQIQVCDDEGNFKSDKYKAYPYSGLSFAIKHDNDNNPDCPIAGFYEDGGMVGTMLYDSEDELREVWNRRI